MRYRVILEEAAQRDFKHLDPLTARRVRKKLLLLETNPRPVGVRKLKDVRPPRYRLRVGDWRILYTVDDRAREVRVYRIKHRREIYR